MSVSTHVDIEQFRNVIRSSVSITFDAECREHIGFDVRCHLRSEEKNKHKLVENVLPCNPYTGVVPHQREEAGGATAFVDCVKLSKKPTPN